jgi:CDP-glucose 4,6-dehydratase
MKKINFWKNKRVLITGHTGFKGSWLTFYLHNLGSKVIGYSLKPEPYHKLFLSLNIKKKISHNIYGNILDKKKLQNVINKYRPEIIFHLAAQPFVIDSYIDPLNTINTNVNGTVNLLDIIKSNDDIKSVVIITTDKCYKVKKVGIKFYREDSELGGKDPYSASKACVELLTKSYVNSFFNYEKRNSCTNISTARSGNILGGGDWGKYRLVPDIINISNSNKVLTIRGINSIRPWIHILDTLTGYLKLAEKNYSSKKFVGAWNFSPSEKETKKVKNIIDYFWLNRIIKKKQIKIVKNNYFETKTLMLNNNKARRFLKWKPKLNFLETLRFTLEWYNAYKKNENMEQFSLKQIEEYLAK